MVTFVMRSHNSPPGGDDGGTCGFDPGDHAAFAGAAAPIHGGFPAGQRRS